MGCRPTIWALSDDQEKFTCLDGDMCCNVQIYYLRPWDDDRWKRTAQRLKSRDKNGPQAVLSSVGNGRFFFVACDPIVRKLLLDSRTHLWYLSPVALTLPLHNSSKRYKQEAINAPPTTSIRSWWMRYIMVLHQTDSDTGDRVVPGPKPTLCTGTKMRW